MPPVLAVLSAEALAWASVYAGEAVPAATHLLEVVDATRVFGHRVRANVLAVYAWAGRDEDARATWREIAADVTGASADPAGWRGILALVPSATALPRDR